jgi:hypothetical protein
MSKKKKPNRGPNLSPLTLLRPRLDGLLRNPGWATRDATAVYADLTAVTKDIAATQYLPVVIKAFNDADEPVRQQLDALLPEWLQQVDSVGAASTLVEQNALQEPERAVAVKWLAQLGVEATAVTVTADGTFYKAFYGADDLGSQAFVVMLWYANRQQTRVQGLNFLIDFNPPWEGALKDVWLFPKRSPQDAIEQFVDRWRHDEVNIDIQELTATAAKERIIAMLECNRAQDIRLPKDFAMIREPFINHVLSLTDGPDTPPFTLADVDELLHTGQVAESIMKFEQTVGRRVRMVDGKELLVMGDPFDDE